MSVQGNLTITDKFRIYFQLGPYEGPIPEGAGVLINLTDPTGANKLFDIPAERSQGGTIGIKAPFPEDTANSTGTYRVKAQALFVSIVYLAFQKMKIEELGPQYPYGIFSPVGGAVIAGGSGIILLGAKFSKRRRRILKPKK